MSEKRNIRDHKLSAAKYELRRKLYKAFCKDPDLPSDMRDKHRYKLSKLPRKSSFARVRNRCISTGRPRSVVEFFRISPLVFRGLASAYGFAAFDGHKEIVLVATPKPNRTKVSSAAGPQARVVGPLPSGSGPKEKI
uniref:ribosomal protein S14 n=1 Tax=Pinellia ternata TaxID=199225 RepID=UPI0027A56EE0|nr:ribosomal protein S14 [Pinellia ternata]WIM35503.1 ribosomal protein S14 [Pinellia ternata]